MKKCMRCGECCKAEVCEAGIYCYKSDATPCKGLKKKNGKYYCELVDVAKNIDPLKAIKFYVHMEIGMGCYSD